MFLTQTNMIRGLSKGNYKLLCEMCRYANNLYNVALYNIRQYYFQEKQFLKYEDNYYECKANENYALLQAGVSQQILKVVDRNFKSFFTLLRKAKSGDCQFQAVKIPHYREKGGLFNLILSTNAISIKSGFFTVPVSREFKKLHNGKVEIKIPFPERLTGKKIKEVHIIPVNQGQYFKIQYIYEQKEQQLNLNPDNKLAIDIGLDNLATCISTAGTAFIMDGRKLKSINQYWNRRKSKLQSIAMQQGLKTTKQIQTLTLKRNHRVKDYIRKTARYIVNYCIGHGIGTIVCGYNPDFTRGIKLGKINNRQFTQIPFGDLRRQLSSLCQQYGIVYIEQEESYTSKASFPDLDNIPTYDPKKPYTGTFSGKRVKRGLYRSGNRTLVNADVNGAANILRKSKQKFDFEQLCKGLLASPLRIRLA